MKLCFFILLTLFTHIQSQKHSRFDTICKKWKLFGIKELDKTFISIDGSSTLLFKRDGTFEEENSMYKTEGKWEFNNDSTKFSSVILKATGVHLPADQLMRGSISDSIIKLTEDTLIYVSERNTNLFYVKSKP